MIGEWKSEEIEKNLIFFIFVWLGVEKWKDRKNVLWGQKPESVHWALSPIC